MLESAAQGIPAIVTNVGGVPEITGMDYPYLIEADNVDMLTEAMTCAFNGRSDLVPAASALQERVRVNFSTSGMARSILNVYHSLDRTVQDTSVVAT